MRSSVGTLLLAFLLAGANGDDVETKLYDKGHFAEITVTTFTDEASECYLVTPSNTQIDLLASESLSDKYEYRPNTLSTCRVRINELDKNDEGVWSLHAVVPSEDDTVNELKEQVNILINGSERSAESVSSEEAAVSGESSKTSAEEGTNSEEDSKQSGEDGSSKEKLETSSQESTGANGDDVENKLYDKGQFAEITVTTFPDEASKCYLVTPSNTQIDLLASESHSDKYEYRPNTLSTCRVRINELDKNDEGVWSLHAVVPSEDDTVNELKEQVNILINGRERSAESVSSEEAAVSGESSKTSAEEGANSEEDSKQSGEDGSSKEKLETSSQESTGANGDDVENKLYDKGQFAEITVTTFPDEASKCYLVTPSNTQIDLLASESHSDKYEYRPNTLSTCRVRINELDKNDEGVWSLHAVVPSEDDTVNELKEQVNILINGRERSAESVSSEEAAVSGESSKTSAEEGANSEEDSKQSGEDGTSKEKLETSSQESTGANGDDVETKLYDKGQFAEITVTTFPDEASKCYLVTPSNTQIDLLASESHSDKYEYRPNTLSTCRVRINELDKNDEGVWCLHAVVPSGDDTVNELKEQVNILINGRERSAESVSSMETSGSGESSKTSAEEGNNSEEVSKQSGEDGTSEEKLETSSQESSGANGDDVETKLYDEGQFAEITVTTFPDEASKCYLVTPSYTQMDLLASESLSDKYEYRPNTLSTCRVRINELDKNDEGVWSLHAVVLSEDDTVNELKEQVNILINGRERSAESVSSEETAVSGESSKTSAEEDANSEEDAKQSGEDDTSEENLETSSKESTDLSSSEEEKVFEVHLSALQFVTRTGLNVDINIPKIHNTEKCTLTKPDGSTVDVREGIAGVTAQGSSDFVSCRVVVGPMEPSLIGEWVLCGSYEENNVIHRRCQNTEIVWRNANNPDSMWDTTINPKFNHVVHLGGTLNPSVRGSGSVATCHLVTPDGEDLVVTRDREYQDVRLVQSTDSACSIAIGPIADRHLGDWEIYGTFTSALWGYNEVRLPINMALYDPENPYDQAYNVTILNPAQYVVNLGSTIPVEVTGTGNVDLCQFTMPSGQTYLSTGPTPVGVSFVAATRVGCRVSVGPITEEMVGDWLLVGKFNNLNIHTENKLMFKILLEDPSNPIEEDRTVQYLNEQLMDTEIGATHRITIATDFLSSIQSCHIRTPEGLQYTIMEGFNIPGVEVIDPTSSVACGVTIQVSEDLIGNWTLIAREMRSSVPTERRLPFIIYVEETVEAVPNEITIKEGNSIYVRLVNPTDLHASCHMTDPNNEVALASLDDSHKETCGFVVPAVDAGHSGTWNIVYGTKIIYKAPLIVNVNARVDHEAQSLVWVEHAPVNITVGPEHAVYCRVLSPKQEVVFDGFGRCQVVLNRALWDQHEGQWVMVLGLPGRIETENHIFQVKVFEAERKPTVSYSVTTNKPSVELSCSVKGARQKTGCLFRDPAGNVLVASQGVSEGRYVFHVYQDRFESDHYYNCSLQIMEPSPSDLGLWRCDLEAEEENYYNFLTVLCPWAMQDPAIAETVIIDPTLIAQVNSVSAEEGEPVTLSCAARAPLRYCFFRAPNGTVFNVGPGTSSPSVEYAGAGLDAGECGARFQGLLPEDTGNWTCHAGVDGQEQFDELWVSVQAEMEVRSFITNDRNVVVQAQVANHRMLEYCRFIRSDGFGFTSENIPFPHYKDESRLTEGFCQISVAVSQLYLRPWSVVAKIQGRDGEISRVTRVNLPPPEFAYYNALYMWLPLMVIMVACLIMAGAFAPAKNRSWAFERASNMRASMRDGVRASLRRFPSWRKPAHIKDTNPAA